MLKFPNLSPPNVFIVYPTMTQVTRFITKAKHSPVPTTYLIQSFTTMRQVIFNYFNFVNPIITMLIIIYFLNTCFL